MNTHQSLARDLNELLAEDKSVLITVEGFRPLHIERRDDFTIAVAQIVYRGDDMLRDPEIIFVLRGDEALPYAFTNDALDLSYVTDPGNPELTETAARWLTTLRRQGYFGRRPEGFIGPERRRIRLAPP